MAAKDRATLNSDADTNLPDNTAGEISPADVRGAVKDLADSAILPEDLPGATGKTTPVDADTMPINDSAASNVLKKVTWANVKATLKTYFDTLYQTLAATLTSWAAITRASGFDTFVATPSSANLRALLTDEVGTGAAYFVGGALGTPASGTATNLTGLPAAGVVNTALVAAAEDQGPLTGGATVTVKDLGNLSGQTITPDPGDRPIQKITNNGAGTIAPGSNVGCYLLVVKNTTGAGAVTTSGWQDVSGEAFDTTTTSEFLCHCTVVGDFSAMVINKVA